MSGFTHFDQAGNAAMVDVSDKPVTARTATARARVLMQPATLAMIEQGSAKKGDVLGIASEQQKDPRAVQVEPDGPCRV